MGGKWRRSLRLRDLSEDGGVLISKLNGVLLIGKLPGLAMAASEEMRPVPSVEEPEGADIAYKEELSLRLITCFTGLPSHNATTSRRLFLEPRTTYIVYIQPVRQCENTPRRPAELAEDGEVKLARQM